MEHVLLAFLSCFLFRLCISAILADIQLILNELFLSVAYLLNDRWLMMNDYEILKMFSKHVKK